MESKQNVFFLNWTHFDTFWVILTCFFWAVLWVCSNVQGFIAFAFVSICSFFTKRGVQSLHKESSTFPAMEPTYHCYSSAWGAQCDLLGLSFGSSSSRLPIGKRRTVPTPVGVHLGFSGSRKVGLEKWQVSQVQLNSMASVGFLGSLDEKKKRLKYCNLPQTLPGLYLGLGSRRPLGTLSAALWHVVGPSHTQSVCTFFWL